jgi:hypothetical protein
MDKDRNADSESFLGRWSRRKIEARATPAAPADTAPATAGSEDAPLQRGAPNDAPPQLPPIEDLTMESDYRGFFHPKVDEDLRRGALRKLFSDPHFNMMDGLDTYIDDYSQTEPIPPAMLAGLRQAQKIIQWAEGGEDEPEPEERAAEAAPEEELDWRERPAAIAAPEIPEQDAEIDWRERALAPSGGQPPDTTETNAVTKTANSE